MDLPWLQELSFVILGAMVALDPKLLAGAVVSLAGLYGMFHSLLSGSALAANAAGPLNSRGPSRPR